VATAQQGKEIKLTEKHIQSFMAAYNDMVKVYESADPDKPDDPQVEAQVEAIAKKNGFASLAEFDDVSVSISAVDGAAGPAGDCHRNRDDSQQRWSAVAQHGSRRGGAEAGARQVFSTPVELARGARARRYVFDFDEVAEAEAQGLPYVLAPRVLSREEWIEQYSGDKAPGEDDPSPPWAALIPMKSRTHSIACRASAGSVPPRSSIRSRTAPTDWWSMLSRPACAPTIRPAIRKKAFRATGSDATPTPRREGGGWQSESPARRAPRGAAAVAGVTSICASCSRVCGQGRVCTGTDHCRVGN